MKTIRSLCVVCGLGLISSSFGFTVYGDMNPWLAGMPDGSTAGWGEDSAPGQSPYQYTGAVAGGMSYTFTATGQTSNTPTLGVDADGGGFTGRFPGSENGISDVVAPLSALMGVYLDDSQPDSSAAPAGLDFSSIGTNFTALAPGLKQVFFIGDGLTGNGSGDSQVIYAPTGATRLFLGTMDGFGWWNNAGELDVSVQAVPEPMSLAVLGLGALGLRRRKNS
jgi:hypothetical protein